MRTTTHLIAAAAVLVLGWPGRTIATARQDGEQRAKSSPSAPNPPQRTPPTKPAPSQGRKPAPPQQLPSPVYQFPYGIYPNDPHDPYGDYPFPWYVYLDPRPEWAEGAPHTYGGIRLEIPQEQAAVFVDGFYAGVVRDFNDPQERLDLVTGPHHIELRAARYQTVAFDVAVRPGETLTYRSAMQPEPASQEEAVGPPLEPDGARTAPRVTVSLQTADSAGR